MISLDQGLVVLLVAIAVAIVVPAVFRELDRTFPDRYPEDR